MKKFGNLAAWSTAIPTGLYGVSTNPNGVQASMRPQIVTATRLPVHGPHGVQTGIRIFAQHLDREDRPQGIVTPYTAHPRLARSTVRMSRLIRLLSPAVALCWYRRFTGYFLRRALQKHLAEQRADVVLARCPISADAALRVRQDQRVVISVHFNVSQADESVGNGAIRPGGINYRAIRTFERRVLGQVDGIVCVSGFVQSELQRLFPEIASVPTIIVHNCTPVPPERMLTPDRDLITVGSLEPRKNQMYLLDVLAAARKRGRCYGLTVVGDGQDRARLVQRAEQLGLIDQIEFIRYHPDPPALMARYRLYCHTALMESFGRTVLEAMAEGLPVLAGAVGAIPEVVRPGRDGEFWPLDNALEAAEVLIGLMEDENRRLAMGSEARRRALETFSSDALNGKLLAFLDEVRARPRRC